MTVFSTVRHISVSIERPPAEVYAFAGEPRNLQLWAAGLSSSRLEETSEGWVAESPMGRVVIRFAERNQLGVLDHDVTLESGVTVHNPFRGDRERRWQRGRVHALPTVGRQRR